MQLKNTRRGYGLISILVHWAMAVLIFGLFGLGIYMTGLQYYDPWYKAGPDLHRSIGVLVMTLLVGRLIWRLKNQVPEPEPGNKAWEIKAAELTHWAFYGLLLLIGISGYLITTADGRGLPVFGLFEIPSLIAFEHLEDLAGVVHWALAMGLTGLVAMHAGAAIKHHFIDKDRTLVRMLGTERSDSVKSPNLQPEPVNN